MTTTTPTSSAIATLSPPRRASSAEQAWRRFLRNKWAVGALVFILLQVFIAVFAKYVAPYDPYLSDYSAAYAGPSDKYLLGNDDLGRDLLSRLIYGTRVSLAVGVFSQVFLVLIGVPLGAIAGMMGGWVDYTLTRLIDVLSSVPGLLLYILLMIALGAGLQNIILAFALTGWIGIARLVRGQVLSLKESDFVRAARAMGAGTSWIVRTHIVRNSLTPVIVAMTLGVPGAMFAEAGLSFLGLGVPPPTASWGQIVGIYQGFVRTSPHLVLYPSLVLAVTMLAWIILGDGVREALDPNIRS
jgi:oligopeptide transport system permease protein